MQAHEYKSFSDARAALRKAMLDAPAVKTERWQGIQANTDTHEIHGVNFRVDLDCVADLDHWRKDIQPNLPWADDHFLERVGGEPLNPGHQWKMWPWAKSAENFVQGRFNHTYMERLWPKFARRTEDGKLSNGLMGNERRYPGQDNRPKFGIAHGYGDLQDLVELLAFEPHTRQAYIPLFFPEDTGTADGGRKVCTLGYQILVRDKRAHIWYPLRSCDLIRHWADDCYLAVRLLLWVIERCRARNPDFWDDVLPGMYEMHATSLHVFRPDMDKLRKEAKGR